RRGATQEKGLKAPPTRQPHQPGGFPPGGRGPAVCGGPPPPPFGENNTPAPLGPQGGGGNDTGPTEPAPETRRACARGARELSFPNLPFCSATIPTLTTWRSSNSRTRIGRRCSPLAVCPLACAIGPFARGGGATSLARSSPPPAEKPFGSGWACFHPSRTVT